MCANEHLSFFEELQPELDEKYEVLCKREFDIYLDYYNSIKNILFKRDAFIVAKQNDGFLHNFWEKAVANCDIGFNLLPLDVNNRYDASFIKSMQIEYIEGYICSVRLDLNANDYVLNTTLVKKINIESHEVEITKVDWKGNNKCDLLSFFENDDEQFEVFDYLSEIYINAYYYFSLDDVNE